MTAVRTTLDRASYESLLDTLRGSKRGKTLKVPKDALEKIITDNTTLIAELEHRGVKVEDAAET